MAWSTEDIPDRSGRVAVVTRKTMATLWEVSEREIGVTFEVVRP